MNERLINNVEKRFMAEIISGNELDLFSMNGLALFTGSTRRRLDAETLSHHELVIKVSDLNVKRDATCHVVINVNDLNDNIELVIYDKLDTR